MYISSVLAASAAGSGDSPPSGGKIRDTIFKAAERGSTDAVLGFLRKRRSAANSRNEHGHAPLHIATLHNCYDVVECLLRNEADVNLQDNFGWTPLHFAASGKNEKLLQLFLECPRIDVTLTNDSLNTPLHYVAKNFMGVSRTTLKAFIERGTNVNAQNALGETPMHAAALKNNHVMIERLIEVGARTDVPTKLGETPLNWATKGGDEKTISALLRSHKQLDSNQPPDRIGRTPLPGSTGNLYRSSTKLDSTSNAFSSDLRYELTFMDSEEIVLHDDNWDKCLYDGGMQLLVDSTESVVLPAKPHMSAIKQEELPLSKLFHLYLVISGRNKTDPEIVHWIVDFLTGPKKLYLEYLIEHFSYRIRVRTAQSTKAAPVVSQAPSSARTDSSSSSSSSSNSHSESQVEFWKIPTAKDAALFNAVFSENDPKNAMPKMWLEDEGSSATSRDRSVSLWEHRTRVSHFHWEIAPTALQMGDKLGSGAFGIVHRAKWMGTDVAVKLIDSNDFTPDDYRGFLAEISMQSNLRHPNVLMLLGGSLTPPNLYFVTEFMHQGSLDKVLRAFPKLDWSVRLSMALDIARGLFYLHHQSPPILHRDLKSLNILVDEHFRAKVSDFGLSVDKSAYISMKMGTLNWVAPECIDATGLPYDEKADMWSFGMVLWELVSGRIPFAGMSQLQTLRRIDMHELEEIPDGVEPRYGALIEWCWHTDSNKRPSITQALNCLEEIARGS
jgi:ankyrin repeat protein